MRPDKGASVGSSEASLGEGKLHRFPVIPATAPSEESCIRKAVEERGLIPGSAGLADTTAEDEAATGTAFALM